MLRLLATPRWLGFTALVIVVIVAFGALSSWQFDRAESKRLDAAQVRAGVEAPPASVAPGDEPEAWTAVALRGTYGTPSLAVRQRPQDGATGWWVLTPLTTDSGTAWVARGWLPADGPATTVPTMPAPPTGPVTVTGTWHPFETSNPARQEGLPAGMLAQVDAAALPDPGAFAGYLRARSPEPGLVPVATPQVDDLRNTSYAWQWLLFALIATTGWFLMLRREARESDGARP